MQSLFFSLWWHVGLLVCFDQCSGLPNWAEKSKTHKVVLLFLGVLVSSLVQMENTGNFALLDFVLLLACALFFQLASRGKSRNIVFAGFAL